MNRSPLYYVGDKYKIMSQISKILPKKVNRYFEPFCGGGSSFLNAPSNILYLNDLDKNVIEIHKMLASYSKKPKLFFDKLKKIENVYNLSASWRRNIVPLDLRSTYKKTYFAQFNKRGYNNLKKYYNTHKSDYFVLYILVIYGFNRILRFNSCGNFNLPVGNVDMNNNVINALECYFNAVNKKKIIFYSSDYKTFLKIQDFKNSDFIYLDPPYLISNSEYNKFWNENDELELLQSLDRLHKMGVKFAISNLINHRGKTNLIFQKWSKKYKTHPIKSNYISFNDNSIKKSSYEVIVTNYES